MNYLGDVSGASSGSSSRAYWTMKQPLYLLAWEAPVRLSNFFVKSKVDKTSKFSFVRAFFHIESDCSNWIFLKLYVNNNCVYDRYFENCFLRGLRQQCCIELTLPNPITKKDTIELTLSTQENEKCYLILNRESSIQFY
jgi:hypothetical protein